MGHTRLLWSEGPGQTARCPAQGLGAEVRLQDQKAAVPAGGQGSQHTGLTPGEEGVHAPKDQKRLWLCAGQPMQCHKCGAQQ